VSPVKQPQQSQREEEAEREEEQQQEEEEEEELQSVRVRKRRRLHHEPPPLPSTQDPAALLTQDPAVLVQTQVRTPSLFPTRHTRSNEYPHVQAEPQQQQLSEDDVLRFIK
jgi:hypothetical protein